MICSLGIIERRIWILLGRGLLGYTLLLLMYFGGPAIGAVALITGAV